MLSIYLSDAAQRVDEENGHNFSPLWPEHEEWNEWEFID
jgi:hypothetical protein